MNIEISPPWITHYKKIKEMFGKETNLSIGELDTSKDIIEFTIHISDPYKYQALDRFLIKELDYGSAKMKINLSSMSFNEFEEVLDEIVLKHLFCDNSHISKIETKELIDPDGNRNAFVYIIFKKDVIQFYNSNLNDVNGNLNILAQDMILDILDVDKISIPVGFCTDI